MIYWFIDWCIDWLVLPFYCNCFHFYTSFSIHTSYKNQLNMVYQPSTTLLRFLPCANWGAEPTNKMVLALIFLFIFLTSTRLVFGSTSTWTILMPKQWHALSNAAWAVRGTILGQGGNQSEKEWLALTYMHLMPHDEHWGQRCMAAWSLGTSQRIPNTANLSTTTF